MFAFMIVLGVLIGYLGSVPFLAGAKYRFRGRMMNLLESFGLWGAGAFGFLTGSLPVLLLTALIGAGISFMPNSQKRLE